MGGMKHRMLVGMFAIVALLPFSVRAEEKVMRIGIIGLDTSHVPAFTKIFNDPKATGDLAGFKVVVGFPGGSQDIPSSRDRVAKFTADLKGMGVEIVDSIPELLKKCDM